MYTNTETEKLDDETSEKLHKGCDSQKICKECRNHVLSEYRVSMCIRNIKTWRDNVTGDVEYSKVRTCYSERRKRIPRRKNYCGPEGKFYLEK